MCRMSVVANCNEPHLDSDLGLGSFLAGSRARLTHSSIGDELDRCGHPASGSEVVEMMSVSRISVISSDGHVAARMSDYRPYLDPAYRPEFDDFLVEYEKHGVVTTDPTNIGEC